MKELTVEITNICTHHCPWCGSDSRPDGQIVPYAKVSRLLKKYRLECDLVRLSGGEPTRHPVLPKIVSRAKQLGYRVVLLTNGFQADRVLEAGPVDEYVVNAVDSKALGTAYVLKRLKKVVSMEVVLDSRNETMVGRSITFSLTHRVPIRLLVLQRQRRAEHREPMSLISWTGDKGCHKEEKITVAHDGKVTSCSALKGGECSILGQMRL